MAETVSYYQTLQAKAAAELHCEKSQSRNVQNGVLKIIVHCTVLLYHTNNIVTERRWKRKLSSVQLRRLALHPSGRSEDDARSSCCMYDTVYVLCTYVNTIERQALHILRSHVVKHGVRHTMAEPSG